MNFIEFLFPQKRKRIVWNIRFHRRCVIQRLLYSYSRCWSMLVVYYLNWIRGCNQDRHNHWLIDSWLNMTNPPQNLEQSSQTKAKAIPWSSTSPGFSWCSLGFVGRGWGRGRQAVAEWGTTTSEGGTGKATRIQHLRRFGTPLVMEVGRWVQVVTKLVGEGGLQAKFLSKKKG